MSVIESLLNSGAIAIVRADNQNHAQLVANMILDAGLTSIEITMTTPGALELVEMLAARTGVCVGVGTVLNPVDVQRAKSAGAQFIISPDTNPAVISATKDAGLLSIPGVASSTDVSTALSFGADILKLFPASTYGPSHLKALRDPYPNKIWCPTGGLTLATVPDWFAAGASILGLGGPLVKGGIDAIEANVSAFLAAIAVSKKAKS